MLDPKAARFRDAWEDWIAPRWKDAPDDPKYGFGKNRGRFRVRDMTFLGHAGLYDVYLGTLGDASNPGIQFCRQASDGFLIGDRWVSCSAYDDAPSGADSDDPGWSAATFARFLRSKGLAVPGVPRCPEGVFDVMRAEYARIAGLGAGPTSKPMASPKRTRVSGVVGSACSETGDEAFVPAGPSVVARYGVFDGGRALEFLGRSGPLDVWQDTNVVGDDGLCLRLVAVSSPGIETAYRHDLFRDGTCVDPNAPPWVQPVVGWIVKDKAPEKREDADALSSAGAVSDEDLADALKESEWHPRFVAATKGTYPDSARCLLAWVKDRRTATSRSYPGQEALHGEMLAIIAEIVSGRIYGSRDRCAVCGGDLAIQSWKWKEADGTIRWVNCHSGDCDMNPYARYWGGLSVAAAVLYARRLLAEKRHGVPAFAAAVSLDASGTIPDHSGRGNDLTTKPGNPLPCAGCLKPSTRHLNHLRICAECGDLLLWTRGGGKPEVLAKLALEHADTMAAELRDPHMRHGLVEMALDVFNGMAFRAGIPEAVSGKTADEMLVIDERAHESCRRLAAVLRSEADAERRAKVGGLRTDAECRAVCERMIREHVPAWFDPRRR